MPKMERRGVNKYKKKKKTREKGLCNTTRFRVANKKPVVKKSAL